MISPSKDNIRAILPKQVRLFEVGPRDGFQMENKLIPTWFKIEMINKLVDAGIDMLAVADTTGMAPPQTTAVLLT